MSSRLSFTSLPREIRDQIYKEVLVSSTPEYMFHTTHFHDDLIGPGQELLNPAYSNQQIARESREIYYGYNAFAADATLLPQFLAARFDLGDGEWFFPSDCVREMIITIDFEDSANNNSLDRKFRGISLCCPKLRKIVLKSFPDRNRAGYIPRCVMLNEVKNIVSICKRLKSMMRGLQLELYLPGFCCNVDHLVPGDEVSPCIVLGEEDVSWLMD